MPYLTSTLASLSLTLISAPHIGPSYIGPHIGPDQPYLDGTIEAGGDEETHVDGVPLHGRHALPMALFRTKGPPWLVVEPTVVVIGTPHRGGRGGLAPPRPTTAVRPRRECTVAR